MKTFIQKHGDKTYPHSEELVSAVRRGSCTLSKSPSWFSKGALVSELIATYRTRAEFLSAKEDKSLLSDVLSFCKKMEEGEDSRSLSWIFDFPSGFSIVVFEGRPSHEILGCMKILDID